jgi:hypothetical protein
MKNKGNYYKLDEVGFVGVQKNSSASTKSYHKKKTGQALKQLRMKSEEFNNKRSSGTS